MIKGHRTKKNSSNVLQLYIHLPYCQSFYFISIDRIRPYVKIVGQYEAKENA